MKNIHICHCTPKHSFGKESGMVLVAAMLIMALLSILALAGVGTSTLEVKIAAQDRNSKQTFYLCEAAMEMAKFEINRGWGKPSVAGTSPNFTLTIQADDMPAAALTGSGKSTACEDDKWENFTLEDNIGSHYTIENNTCGGTSYAFEITANGHIEEPEEKAVRIFYRNEDSVVAYSGIGITAGNTMEASGAPGWTDNIWAGYRLLDSLGVYFDISTNVGDVLALSGTPDDSGAFSIIRAVGEANQFTIFKNPSTGETGAPNDSWKSSNAFDEAWYLKDSNDDLFQITNYSYNFSDDSLTLSVSGATSTPANGAFEIATNPWSLTSTAPIVTLDQAPSGVDYGTVSIEIAPKQNGDPEEITITATALSPSSQGNTKQIQMDGRISASGRMLLSNWRQMK